MQFFAEVHNSYRYGPAYEPGGNHQEGILACAVIDAWKTGNDEEQGQVLASVLLSTHGDIIVDYHDNSVRMMDQVTEKINEVKEDFKKLWEEYSAKSRHVILMDAENAVLDGLLYVHNYSDQFDVDLSEIVQSWKSTSEEFFQYVFQHLKEKGYQFDVCRYEQLSV